MQKNIIRDIRKFVDISESEVVVFNKYVETHQLKKKEFLLQANSVCKHLYFVEKGCLRMYFINKKGAEQITQFALDNWWISDFLSFIESKPSEYFIQTVEKSEILSIDENDFEALLKELPQMERYFRTIMQRAWAASQLRIKYMYELSKEEYYNHFCTSFPEFVQRVPQYMIASYLGLTPEYVSELRKKKA